MDKNVRQAVKNPLENANPISILTYWWLRKLFAKGYKRELVETDLYSPLREDKSDRLGQQVAEAWEKELKRCEEKNDGSKPRLLIVLFKCFAKLFLKVGLVLTFSEFGLRMVQPFLLGKLLRYFTNGSQEWETDIYYYAAAFCILPLIECLLLQWSFQILCHIGMKIRISCSTLIYRKILKLSNSVLENETSAGQMVNYLSNDVNRLDYSVFTIHYVWIGPIQTILIAYLTYREVGWAGIVGTMIFILFIPVQLNIGRLVSRLTFQMAQTTDRRLRLMNQIIGGLQIIKMYVWEIPYSLLVDKARRKEVGALRKFCIVQQFGYTFDAYVPRLAMFVTLLTYVLTGNTISVEKLFMVTAYYNILLRSMTICFAVGVQEIAQGLVSIKRIEKFMVQAEVSKPDIECTDLANPVQPVYFKNVSAKWDDSKDSKTLDNVNLTVKAGNLVAIVGLIGSGKSSLLQAILRELPLENGVLETCGKISFANQRPWIFASSVRQNILFGQPMNEARYNEIIRVCQLNQDLVSFSHGDRTIVGDRGINLSGGQKARINLARALYFDADIYLLDDPLSAVDPHVGSRIVEECICGFLKNKTRILVTHQLQYLKYADTIVVMNNGSVQATGTFEELRNMELDFMKIFKNEDENKDDGDTARIKRLSSKVEKKLDDDSENEPLEVAETRTFGKISTTVLLSYLKASRSLVLVSLTFLLAICTQTMASGNDYFLAFWVNIEAKSGLVSGNETISSEWNGPLSREIIIYIYSAMTTALICLVVFLALSYFIMCMRSSKNLHADMFRSIIRATMYFYNTNPAGRILNRFSKDIGIVDQKLPFSIYDVLMSGLAFLSVVIITAIVNPWLLIPTVFLVLLFYLYRVIYISTSRPVKRMEGITRSPVFDHVGATLQGLTTIRAFKAEQILTKEFDNHQDLHSSCWFLFLMTSRAFALCIESTCLLYVALIMIIFLIFDDLAVAGDIGLVITQIMALSGALQWGLRQTAELENQATSVERILEYSRLEEEPFLDSVPQKKPSKEWPSKGCIEFKNVKLKYGPKGVYVLKELNFRILPKEKIGVVGRTGAGKSSLISALFRLAFIEGEIVIDDIPTDAIALTDFRSKISIIPQEPVLFGGSLRGNLDPFDEYSDSMLWEALQEVELKEMVTDMAAGLNTKVSEDGLNFSVGQRQLLCLVRALVRNNKIMVLDEATANVDPHTDSLIQKTVRRKFEGCTVITVAHRLNTIMDSDKIMVMDQGFLVEYDHPHILLMKKGLFYDMVQKTGPAMATTLSEMAKESFYKISENLT